MNIIENNKNWFYSQIKMTTAVTVYFWSGNRRYINRQSPINRSTHINKHILVHDTVPALN